MTVYEGQHVTTVEELEAKVAELEAAGEALRAELAALRAAAQGGVDELHRAIEQRQAELLKAELARSRS